MTNQQTIIYERIKRTGQYIISALNTTQEKRAVFMLYKQGVVKVTERAESFISFGRNWI